MWEYRIVGTYPIVIGFIPTHVGNTGQGVAMPKLTGSSPRMWGILQSPGGSVCTDRFIPTHVGNTAGVVDFFCAMPVHPHACGEYMSSRLSVSISVGSSPRMWGILAATPRASGCDRFIPTHVGNTPAEQGEDQSAPVHPHACGEYTCGTRRRSIGAGSSPRMWGIPL